MITNSFNVKLTDKGVYKMLYLNKIERMQPHQLEEMFPVSRATIRNIVNGRSSKDCYSLFNQYNERHRKEFMKLFEEIK